jgi:PAS domain S-box-containing protein
MGTSTRVLLIEDSEDDAQLILRELRRADYEPTWERVDTPAALRAALQGSGWDLITCDWVMPQLSAPAALALIQEHGTSVPVIIVSGEVDEEVAVTAMKAGAADFVSKHRLARLVPAAEREWREAAARRARRQTEEAYRTLALESLQGLAIVQDGQLVFANPALTRITGYAAEELLALPAEGVLGLAHPDDRPLIEERMRQRLAGQDAPPYVEYRLLHRTGGTRWVETHTVRILYRGRPALQVACIDITDRKQAQAALRQSELAYRTLVEASDSWIWAMDAAGRITFTSPAVKQILGYEPEECLGRPFADFLAAATNLESAHQAFQRVTNGQPVRGYELSLRRRDGSTVIVRGNGVPLRDADGRVIGTTGTAHDITDLRETEEERARLAAAVEQSAEVIVITDAAGVVVYMNPTAERVTGYSCAELRAYGTNLWFGAVPDADAYRRMRETLARGEVWHASQVHRRKDGSRFELESIVFAVSDQSGQVINYVGLGRDVTEVRKMEAQLRQAQKLEAIGRLAGGVAHEFNNQLTVINGSLDFLTAYLPEGDPRRDDGERIRQATERSAQLVRQLLTFSRQQPQEMGPLDLTALVRELEPILRLFLGERIALRTRTASRLPIVRADRFQIEQLLMNLVTNARDAMAPEGLPVAGDTVTLETASVRVGEHGPDVIANRLRAGHYVMLGVIDNGPGIPPELREHIFEPFFTTKEVGKGTGLGLASVFGIVQQHRGYIECASKPGRGAAFRVYLPQAGGVPSDTQSPGDAHAPA